MRNVEVGVDTGGTFTDVVCREPGQPVRLVKIPSTPSDPSKAVLAALPHLLNEWGIPAERVARFVHGTTVATNAVLERKGANVGLLTTDGFRDTLEIGRQLRHKTYECILEPEVPVFLAPGSRRQEVVERIGADGSVVTPLDEDSVRKAARILVEDEKVEGIAICFLFSFLNPSHERRAAEIIAECYPDVAVSISSNVDPAFREYERTVVTAFDAYIKPVIQGYIGRLEEKLKEGGVDAPLQIMQSRGGITSAEVARRRPVRLFLSGPAGGVIGGRMAGEAVQADNIITVDIGGTSSDIALISEGKPILRSEGIIDGFPVRVGMVDVNAIGAGGGSIAWLDDAGGLRVGPQSAGSEPGPACYARGGERATVTDASIVLGYLNPDYFAGGSLKLDPRLSNDAIEKTIAGPLKMTCEQAAVGIHRVVNAQMAEGIRLVSIRQGLDPRRFALVPLGGAGAIHATALASELGINRVIVPLSPGVLAATGHLCAPISHEMSAGIQRQIDQLSVDEVKKYLAELDYECAELMTLEGPDLPRVEIKYYADVCYVGQSHHLEVPFDLDRDEPLSQLHAEFLALHDRIFGYATDNPTRIVSLRAVHEVRLLRQPEVAVLPPSETSIGSRRVIFATTGEALEAAIYQRSQLGRGCEVAGPAIIEQPDTTVVIDPGWRGEVAEGGTLILTRAADGNL